MTQPHGPQGPQRPQTFQPLQPEEPWSPKPTKKPKRFGWVAASLFALGGLVLGSIGGGDSPTAAPAPTTTVTATVEAGPSSEPTKAPAPKNTAAPKPATTMGEGDYEIGVDVPAGRYQTVVPADSYNCYWERNKDDSGDSIITNENLNPGARASVTVNKGEFFSSSGCGTWTKVG